jgi:hypothetical protein
MSEEKNETGTELELDQLEGLSGGVKGNIKNMGGEIKLDHDLGDEGSVLESGDKSSCKGKSACKNKIL